MADFGGIVGMIAELLTWTGLFAGAAVLILRLVLRAVEGEWIGVDGVIDTDSGANGGTLSGTDGGPQAPAVVRWVTEEGEVRSHELDPGEAEALLAGTGGDLVAVRYARRSPDRIHIDRIGEKVPASGHGLWVLGLILLGVGALAFVASFAVMFLPE